MIPNQTLTEQFPSWDQEIPEYHEGMLEVKLHSDAGIMSASSAMGGPVFLTRATAATAPGLGTLMAYERSGLIRRVIPLSDDGTASAVTGETPMLAMFANAMAPRDREDPNAGVAFVELYRDQDTQSLEAELRRDPAVESVSRVPIRYLLASARRASTTAAAAAAPPVASIGIYTSAFRGRFDTDEHYKQRVF